MTDGGLLPDLFFEDIALIKREYEGMKNTVFFFVLAYRVATFPTGIGRGGEGLFSYGSFAESGARCGVSASRVCVATECRSLRAHRKMRSHAQSLSEAERVAAGRSWRDGDEKRREKKAPGS